MPVLFRSDLGRHFGRRVPLVLGQLTSAQMLAHHDVLGVERLLQHADGELGLRLAAHEDVEGCVIRLGPAVDRDMRLGQHRHPRHATIRREVMKMYVQQSSISYLHTALERMLDVLQVIQLTGAIQIDDQMATGSLNAFALYAVCTSVHVSSRHGLEVVRYSRDYTMIFLLGGA